MRNLPNDVEIIPADKPYQIKGETDINEWEPNMYFQNLSIKFTEI